MSKPSLFSAVVVRCDFLKPQEPSVLHLSQHRTQNAAARALSRALGAAFTGNRATTYAGIVTPEGAALSLRQAQGKEPGTMYEYAAQALRSVLPSADAPCVISNRAPRDVLSWHDLTAAERAEFDYLDTEQRQEEAQFVRYCGVTYDLGEFMSLHSTAAGNLNFKGWHGYHADSFSSGILVRYTRDAETVIMGRFYA